MGEPDPGVLRLQLFRFLSDGMFHGLIGQNFLLYVLAMAINVELVFRIFLIILYIFFVFPCEVV